MEGMKASLHMGVSAGKMSVKHNDRNFDLSRSKFIDSERTHDNIYEDIYVGTYQCSCDARDKPIMTFEEVERKYYLETLEPAYNNQYERYIKNGQYKYAEKMGSLEEWIAKQPKPQEMILQLGNMDYQPSEEDFKAVVEDFKTWLDNEYGKNYKRLNGAYHFDEATNHYQHRGVWEYVHADGTVKFSLTRGMKAAGIELPNPSLKEGVYEIDEDGIPVGEPIKKKPVKGVDYYYNTRQITFTVQCRAKWIETARAHGLVIIDEPDHDAKHLNTPDFRIHQDTVKLNAEVKVLVKENQQQYEHLQTRKGEVKQQQEELDKKKAKLTARINKINNFVKESNEYYNRTSKAQKKQQQQLDERESLIEKREIKRDSHEELIAQLNKLIFEVKEIHKQEKLTKEMQNLLDRFDTVDDSLSFNDFSTADKQVSSHDDDDYSG